MARTRASLIAGATALVVVAAGVVAYATTRPDKPKGGWLPGAPPESYRIAYAVNDQVSGATHKKQDIVDVTPARTRHITRELGLVTAGSALTEDRVYTITNRAWAAVMVVGPGEAGDTEALRAPLAAALKRGLARMNGTGVIVGRECTWWVTKEPLDAGTGFAKATGKSKTKSCVDRRGLLLGEEWRLYGKVVRSRTATAVHETADLSGPLLFDGAKAKPLDPALMHTVVTPYAKPVVAAPPGLTAVTSAVVTEVAAGTTEPTKKRIRTVFRSGVEFATVQDVQDFPGPAKVGSGAPLDVPGLGSGVLRATMGGLVVEIARPNGHLLVVRTSLDEDALVAWLESLA